MLALALDSQLETDNGTSSSELDDHIAATEFVGETVRLDETLIYSMYKFILHNELYILSSLQGNVQLDSNGNRLDTMALLYQYRLLNLTTGISPRVHFTCI